MVTKVCKQCGELKPIEQYRQYYGGRRGTYKTCLSCERINSREKYLSGKGDKRTPAEQLELDKIHALYEVQTKLGLQPPNKQGRRTALVDDLDGMLEKYRTQAAKTANTTPPIEAATNAAPYELMRWLTEPLDKEPEYYLDEVYEQLLATYRPCTGIDSATMMPEYDNTYKAVLDSILERFNDYEDSYYN